jgi:hypothetical protein
MTFVLTARHPSRISLALLCTCGNWASVAEQPVTLATDEPPKVSVRTEQGRR